MPILQPYAMVLRPRRACPGGTGDSSLTRGLPCPPLPALPPASGGREGGEGGECAKCVAVVTNRDSTGASPVVVSPLADN